MRAALGLGMALLAGCEGREVQTEVSQRFSVCAALPPAAAYMAQVDGPDYDLGTLRLNDDSIEVYVGYQPDYPRRIAATVAKLSPVFAHAGTQRSAGVEKILLWKKDRADTAPLLVTFEGKDLTAKHPLSLEPGFVSECADK